MIYSHLEGSPMRAAVTLLWALLCQSYARAALLTREQRELRVIEFLGAHTENDLGEISGPDCQLIQSKILESQPAGWGSISLNAENLFTILRNTLVVIARESVSQIEDDLTLLGGRHGTAECVTNGALWSPAELRTERTRSLLGGNYTHTALPADILLLIPSSPGSTQTKKAWCRVGFPGSTVVNKDRCLNITKFSTSL